MKCWLIPLKFRYQQLVCKSVFLCLFLVILYFYFGVSNERTYHLCYNSSAFDERIELLEDILVSKLQPKFNKCIFFHDTSCRNGIVSISARQACAIESAARANPNADIFLLFASPVGFVKNETQSRIIQAILSYDNVHMRNLNLWTYIEDTPLNVFFNTNKIFQSKYLTSHLSDLLRYVSLYKWGGTYLDLDVIVKQNLHFYENYAGAESVSNVAAGIMNFKNDGIGHDIALECLQDFERNFNGRNWGTNGPGVITRVLKKKCNTGVSTMTRSRCHGFLVLKPSLVYAVHFSEWRRFFDENYANEVLRATNDSILVHVWNKLSASTSVRVGSHTAYGLLARDYCPRVYRSCGDYF